MHHSLTYWLAALYMPGVGPYRLMRWLEFFPTIEKLFQAGTDELQAAGIANHHIQSLRRPNQKLIESDLAWASSAPHHHLICFDDEAYPLLLKKISSPPLVLYLQGEKENLAMPQLAIVGSRHPTTMGLENAEQFAFYLAKAGFTITSGLALGIDAASHQGALAAQGRTIGVAGTGLQHIYPSCHQSLVAKIIQSQGTIISEFPLATPPTAWNFPKRNRIIGGLSMGVLVIEAAIKSGSLITARLAAEHGREVFAVPGSIHQPLARGCHYLIRQGAKLVETAQDILEELGGMQAMFTSIAPPIPASLPAELAPEFALVLKQIEYDMTPIDMIILRSGLTAGEVSSILLTLELHGYIQPVVGGYARIVNTVGHR